MKPISCFNGLVLALLVTAALALGAPVPSHAAGTCSLTAGQVVINEILPAASDGVDWVELYNTTETALDISYCYIDDIASGGGAPIQIPAGTIIPAHGYWTLDRSSYFNNAGDDVRLLMDDQATVLDAYTYPSTGYDASWYRLPDGGAWQGTATTSPTKGATNGAVGTCGTGSWTPGKLEIHHINIGQGDSTLIVSPTGKTVLFDAGESYWNSSADAQVIGPYIESVLGCKSLDYVVISHLHLDHIGYVGYGGLWHLVNVQGFTVGQTLLRDYNTYRGATSGTLDNWVAYLAGDGAALLHPVTAIEGTSQVDLGSGVTFKIVTVDGNGAIIPGNFSTDPTPPSENDYSIGAVISYGAFDEWIGGDLSGQYYTSEYGYIYHDVELSVAAEVGDVDVYRVNHHGSDHSSSATFVNQLDPEVSIISVGNDNTYGHPRQTVMDLLLATSDVYLTERGDPTTNIGDAVVAGHIVVSTTDGVTYTVNGVPYTATEPARTDADGDGFFAEVDPSDTAAYIVPQPNGGCDPLYQICPCQVEAGQVVINEIVPAASSGVDWVELYNTTANTLDIGSCYIDDIANGGGTPYPIPAGTTIAPYGYWTLDRTSYFNNDGDDVRFLSNDGLTILDSFTFGSTSYDVSWYRMPNGGAWQTTTNTLLTKGAANQAITIYQSPTGQSADTGGDGNGFESNPLNAFSDNALFAVDLNSGTNTIASCTNTGKDRHRFMNFGFSLPAGTTAAGIEVQLQAKTDSTTGKPQICVQLSWDGGTSWTTSLLTPTLSKTETAYILGGQTNTWGHAWSATEFNNGNFLVRVINIATNTSRDFYLDWLAVRVTYK
jgi:beta-lactamase superfamily II metal-dependent hydrolase